MKIGIVSDLHTEHWTPKEFEIFDRLIGQRIGDADLVLLAGDIGSGPGAIINADKLFPDKTVCMIAGNHEFYGSDHNHTISVMEEAAKAFPNIHFLNRSTYIGDGVRVIGATLWTDFDLFGTKYLSMMAATTRTFMKGELITPYPDFCHIYKESVNDFVSADEMLEWHVRDRKWMWNELQTPFDGKTILMTHHSPVSFAIHKRFERDAISPCFASGLDSRLIYSNPNVVVWGHTHHSMDVMHAGIRFISNQMGYLREDGSMETGDFGTLIVL